MKDTLPLTGTAGEGISVTISAGGSLVAAGGVEMAWACVSAGILLGLTVLSSGCARDDARSILEDSAHAIAEAGTFRYQGERAPGGAFAGQLASVRGEVLIARRDPSGAYGAMVRACGEVRVPNGTTIPFDSAYDGVVFRNVRTGERALVEGKPEAGGGSLFSEGADGVLLESLIDPEPFKVERALIGLQRLDDSVVEGEPCAVVEAAMPESKASYQRARWHISLRDRLPRRVEMLYTIGEAEGSQVTTATAMRAGVRLEDAAFAIGAPEGFAINTMEQASTLLPVGTPAPDWGLRDPAGTEHTLSSLRGRVVVLDFWATWCGPCRAAMPGVQRVHEKYAGRGVEVFGVDFMDRTDAAAFMKKKGFTYTLLLDGDAVGGQYGVKAIPVFFVIGRDGRIAYRHLGGGETIGEELEKAVEDALAAGDAPRR